MNKLSLFLKSNSDYSVFIETGLNHGEGILNILNSEIKCFEDIYSLEFYQSYIDRFIMKYKPKINKVRFIQGSSDKTLRDVLENEIDTDQGLVVFLDAHGHNSRQAPLIGEIGALGSFGGKMVILIDDVCFIEKAPINPKRTPWANEIGGIEKFMDLLNLIFKNRISKIDKVFYQKEEKHSHGGANYIMWIQVKKNEK